MEFITFITSNSSKVTLAAERLRPYGVSVVQNSFEFEEVQSFDVVEVARHKARQGRDYFSGKFFIEDTGLYIKALNGFPGPMIKPVIVKLGEDRLTKLLDASDSRE